MRSIRPRRGIRPIAMLVALAFASGCSDGVGKTYPVAGKVTIDGTPLDAKGAVVMFYPDRAKGNNTPYEPAATVDSSGNYSLKTKDQRGAPPGWYKVVVTAVGDPAPLPAKGPITHRPTPKSLVHARYGQAKTSPLEIEVVPNPTSGSYDLKLSSN